MRKIFKILIIDDHPLIIDLYKMALEKVDEIYDNFDVQVDEAHDCDSAYNKIIAATKDNGYQLIFLDIKLPPSKDKKLLSGEDLGEKINAYLPQSRIIIATTFNDNYRMHNILKNVNPDALLIKGDIDSRELIVAITDVVKDIPYYSKTVRQLLRHEISSDIVLDKIDRQLLYELSIGTKMKDLPEVLPMSLPGIEKRKRQLKLLFDITDDSDKTLIKVSKDKGFI